MKETWKHFKMSMQLSLRIKSSTLGTEAEMQERRKQPRTDLMSFSQVVDLYTGKLLGYLGDLNLLGAMVIGDEPLEVHSKLTISIQLPELNGLNATRMVLPVRIAYCQKDVSPDYFNIGLEFELVTDRQRTIIDAIMTNYEFRRQSPGYPPHPV
jgi:hypothetical protein